MNKYQEALDYIIPRLKDYRTVKEDNSDFSYNNKCVNDYNAIQSIKELVDKETPMKPNGIQCRKCGSWVMDDTRTGTIHFHRCRNIECEQKIDWSEENE